MSLQLTDVYKSYGPNRVLKGVNLTVAPGSVLSLLGANGAGKSTLLKVLSGAHKPDSGEFSLNGHQVDLHSPAAARRAGMVMVHQEITLVPHMNAVRNVTLASLETLLGHISRRHQEDLARKHLDAVGFRGRTDIPVARLSVGQQQLVEIAKALMVDASVIALDEPTSALSPAEAEHLFTVMRGLRDNDVALIFVSHRLDEVLDISDSISVLRDGTIVADYDAQAISSLTPHQLVEDMMGRPFQQAAASVRSKATAARDIALSVKNLQVTGSAGPAIDLEVARGEIVGIFGLVGAGRTELLRAIFGADPASGEVVVGGKPKQGRGPAAAIKAGMAFLPEDRKSQGLLLKRSLTSNTMLPFIEPRFGYFKRGELRRRSVTQLEAARVSKSPTDLAISLSGGNQQKVLLARWLGKQFDAYLFDEPTRGIDVSTKEEIYGLMERLAANGAGLLVVSSEDEEILRVCHRCIVLHEGSIVDEFGDLTVVTETDLLAAASKVPATV
jgi:ribose transport system ATP-binding protein